ncbi:MAG: alpha/beta hydrolase [Frankiales bacterium]|nr:alpha/beta hydrolase [Frankiales bacterium]
MPYTHSHSARIHWEESGEGTPLLLVMGASWSSEMWYPALASLSARHRVLRFDNRGTGSSRPSWKASIADMARDALAVLDAAGVESAHVYGVSLGGVVIQELALQAPDRVRSLVLGCTGILSAEKPHASRLEVLRSLLPPALVRAKPTDGYGPACPPDRAEADLLALAHERTSSVARHQQAAALRDYVADRAQVAALPMPVLVLHGTADQRVPLALGRELHQTIPGSRLVEYDGAGHNYLVAMGEQSNDDVLDFLAHVDAAVVSA